MGQSHIFEIFSLLGVKVFRGWRRHWIILMLVHSRKLRCAAQEIQQLQAQDDGGVRISRGLVALGLSRFIDKKKLLIQSFSGVLKCSRPTSNPPFSAVPRTSSCLPVGKVQRLVQG